MRDAKIEHYRAGRPFANEGETGCDGGLRILLSGKLAAKCDETFLVRFHKTSLFLPFIVIIYVSEINNLNFKLSTRCV